MLTRRGTIGIEHTVQMGHRLWNLPGLCTNLHGHTWTVFLKLHGQRQKNGLMLDYHKVKKEFRDYLDQNFDHRLCLDESDPLIKHILYQRKEGDKQISQARRQEMLDALYPGLVTVNFLPSTENMAELWAAGAKALFGDEYIYTIELWEGDKNYASITVE